MYRRNLFNARRRSEISKRIIRKPAKNTRSAKLQRLLPINYRSVSIQLSTACTAQLSVLCIDLEIKRW